MRRSPKVRVFNPRHDEHGWHSTHTIVEIVNDDMPSLVDSVTAEINRQGLTVHLVIHPILHIGRDANGNLTSIGTDGAASPESFMQLRIDEVPGRERHDAIAATIERVLPDVRHAVADWRPMLQKLEETATEIGTGATNATAEEIPEARAFLAWLRDDHFTFLGYREYRLVRGPATDRLVPIAKSGLGLLLTGPGRPRTHRASG